MTRGDLLLVQLMEEASEVTKEVSKQLRFGSDSTWSTTKETPSTRVVHELVDLFTLVDMCQKEGLLPVLDAVYIEELYQAKKERVEKYLKVSRDEGRMT